MQQGAVPPGSGTEPPGAERASAPDVDSLYGGTWLLTDTYTGHVVVIGDSGRPNRFDVLWSFGGHAWVSDGSV